MGFVMKVLWQDHTFVMNCTLNALCLLLVNRTVVIFTWFSFLFLLLVAGKTSEKVPHLILSKSDNKILLPSGLLWYCFNSTNSIVVPHKVYKLD